MVSNPRKQTLCLFDSLPKNILIIKKPNDPTTLSATKATIEYLFHQYPDVNVIVEPSVMDELGQKRLHSIDTDDVEEYARVSDFVITLGGDGTVLHASSLFKTTVPPIASFSLGSLGFLLPFCNFD